MDNRNEQGIIDIPTEKKYRETCEKLLSIEYSLDWLQRVNRQPSKTFSSNHKILVSVLQMQVFISDNLEQGFYRVSIGTKISRNNLRGMTGGLSRDKISDMLWELVHAGFIVKDVVKGTKENGYLDAKMYLKPTPKWIPELFKIEKQETFKTTHAPKCPHCGSENIITICKDCGAQFTLEEMDNKAEAEKEAKRKYERTARGKTKSFYDLKALAPYEHEKEYDLTPEEKYHDDTQVENSTPDVAYDVTPIIDLQSYVRIPICPYCDTNQNVELAQGHDYYVCSKCSHRVS